MAEVWTIKDVLGWCTKYLEGKSDTPRLDSELLMCDALACDRIHLYCYNEKPLTPEERAKTKSGLVRRAGGEPIAYILGYKEFYGYQFKVDSTVLIPRPETEHLVEETLNYLKTFGSQQLHGLDVGTGSGCIAITLQKELENLQMEAWDISAEALAVAQINAKDLDVNINFKACDALKQETWHTPSKFDFICSNPPYIADSELDLLSNSVKKFEPHRALFAKNDGLAFYEVLAKESPKILNPNGTIFLEIGMTQNTVVSEILEGFGWKNIRIINDLARLPRVVCAHL